jgi:hypothetical protein
MNDERQQMRSTLVCAAGIVGWILCVAETALVFSLRHSLQTEKAVRESERAARESEKAAYESEKAALKSAQAKLESERTARKSEEALAMDRLAELAWQLETQQHLLQQSNEKTEQLASAAAILANHDLAMPSHPLLWQRTEQEGKRFIGRDGIARLRAMLKNAPAFDVEIGCVQNDADALAISEELRVAFEAAGSKVRELVRHPTPPTKLPGVSIHSKPKFDDVLGDIVGQIFREVSQEKNQWVGKDEIGAAKPGGPEPDIRIFVGSK